MISNEGVFFQTHLFLFKILDFRKYICFFMYTFDSKLKDIKIETTSNNPNIQ